MKGAGAAAWLVRAAVLCVVLVNVVEIVRGEDSPFFVGALAMVAELVWVVAAGSLLASVLSAAAGGADGEGAPRVARELSLQSLGMFAVVFGFKALQPASWRWHELPRAGVAEGTTFACLGAAFALTLRLKVVARARAAEAPPSWGEAEGLGHELLVLHAPAFSAGAGAGGARGALVACAMLSVFLLPVLALGALLYAAEPASIVADDARNHVAHPLLSCVLQAADCLALLPQFFVMMKRRREMRDASRAAGAGAGANDDDDDGDGDDPLRCVGPELASWVLWLVGQRVCHTLDGAVAIYSTYEDARWNDSRSDKSGLAGALSGELFFTVGAALNLLLLSDFAVLLVRAKCRRRRGAGAGAAGHPANRDLELLPTLKRTDKARAH
jgi:hypothetical protein